MIDETADEIREMQSHSSSVVAVKAARSLEALLDREFAAIDEYLVALERNSDALRRASPSHATLQTSQREIVRTVKENDPASVERAKALTAEAIDNITTGIETAKDEAAARTADLFEDGMTILTHDYSTTVLTAIEEAIEEGIELTIYVTEARPRVLGRKTVRELAEMAGIDAHLIVDAASGSYLDRCDAVFLGMTCIAQETYYNRVGTYPIVATAADVGTPVTVCGSSMKIVAGNFEFEVEHRPVSEVLREPPEGFHVENPVYDATPTRLLSRVVTEGGIETPDAVG